MKKDVVTLKEPFYVINNYDYFGNTSLTLQFENDIVLDSYKFNNISNKFTSNSIYLTKPIGNNFLYDLEVLYYYDNKLYNENIDIHFLQPQGTPGFAPSINYDEVRDLYMFDFTNITNIKESKRFEILIYQGEKLVEQSLISNYDFKNYSSNTEYRVIFNYYYFDLYSMEEKCLSKEEIFIARDRYELYKPYNLEYEDMTNTIYLTNWDSRFQLINIAIYYENELYFEGKKLFSQIFNQAIIVYILHGKFMIMVIIILR